MVLRKIGEPLANEFRNELAGRRIVHAIEALRSESVEQQVARGGLFDSARAQVEELLFFNLAYGGAMRALDVVGVDFELRLGVDARIITEEQIAVGLLGVGLLRVLVTYDAAVEDAARAIIENAVVKLAARTLRLRVLHQHVVVEVLASSADEKAVDEALRA